MQLPESDTILWWGLAVKCDICNDIPDWANSAIDLTNH